jgi:hypothetical protein
MRDYADLPIYVRNELERTLDRFNADKVHDLMSHMNWRWASSLEGVPYPWEIREAARGLMYDAWRYCQAEKSEHATCRSGGLRADFWNHGSGCEFGIVFEAVSS